MSLKKNTQNSHRCKQYQILTQAVCLDNYRADFIGLLCMIIICKYFFKSSKNIIKVERSSRPHLLMELRLSACLLITFFMFMMPYGTGCNYMITHYFFPKHVQIVGIQLMSKCLIFCFSSTV